MGLFGGGGGGGADISAGVSAIQAGTAQSVAATQRYYKEGLDFLKTGAKQAQGYLAPYGVAGSTALDELYDTLGMARPELGSAKLTAALQNEDYLKGLQSAAPSKKKGWLTPDQFTPYNPNAGANAPWAGHTFLNYGGSTSGGLSFDENTGTLQRAAVGAMDQPNLYQDLASKGLTAVLDPTTGKYKLQSLNQDKQERRALTADEQAQWDMIQQYRNGNLAMTDPNELQDSILNKLVSTPGYQFLMQEGLQGVDRSAAARGLLGSGAAIKGAERYATGLAEQTYTNRVNQLAAAAGMGQQTMQQQAGTQGALGAAMATLGQNAGANTSSAYSAQAASLANLYGAQAQANAQSSSSLFSGLGSIIGAGISAFSDARLKKNVKRIGTHPNGLPVYEFEYLWDDEKHVGFMSHEVKAIRPEAVKQVVGFDVVDYGKAGV